MTRIRFKKVRLHIDLVAIVIMVAGFFEVGENNWPWAILLFGIANGMFLTTVAYLFLGEDDDKKV